MVLLLNFTMYTLLRGPAHADAIAVDRIARLVKAHRIKRLQRLILRTRLKKRSFYRKVDEALAKQGLRLPFN